MENVLLTAANIDIICEECLQFMQDNYFDDVNVDSLRVELLAFKEICKDEQIDFFADVLCLLKSKEMERALLLSVQIVVDLLLINPTTSETPRCSGYEFFFVEALEDMATLNDDAEKVQ